MAKIGECGSTRQRVSSKDKVVDTVEGDYVSVGAAKKSDLWIPFVDLMWQRASWPEICPLIMSISDDFHNMGTSVAKLRYFHDSQKTLANRSASRFASTELEYLVMLTRGVFDLLQEMVSNLWSNSVQLLDEAAELRRRARKLPETFSKIVLRDKREIRSAKQIESEFGLPKPLAEEYERVAPFFSQLRDVRDSVVHSGADFGIVFATERGFCVNPKAKPFSEFSGWRPEHYYNENIASVLPWIANVVLQTIQACNGLMNTFGTIIKLPPEIAPGYRIFVRGPHNEALAELLQVHSGASFWWG